MGTRLTESELLARDEKKVAERKAKIANKAARDASKDVRALERLCAILLGLVNDRGWGDLKVSEARSFAQDQLMEARKQAAP